ncbi:MAG: DUF6132 family protein [Candidatus Cloacimonetes bacterium]|nr:DUF6132 family protein [Candidatus Cloacimonadota bacterium]
MIRILSVIAGGILGWLYYRFVGCVSGSCPITSNPYITIIFGAAFIGLLLPDIIKKKKAKEIDNDQS